MTLTYAKLNPKDFTTPEECQREFQKKVLQLTDVVPLLPNDQQDEVMALIEDLGERFDDAIRNGGKGGELDLKELLTSLTWLKKLFTMFKVMALTKEARVIWMFTAKLTPQDLPVLIGDLVSLVSQAMVLLNPKKPRTPVPEAPSQASDDPLAYNTVLAKLCQKLKRDSGAKSITQNYKGTGKQSFRRQLWVTYKNGAVIDLWLEADSIRFGGVVTKRPEGGTYRLPKGVAYGSKAPDQVYAEVAKELKAWANP